jgi:non-ribosomal peptide synthetase component F
LQGEILKRLVQNWHQQLADLPRLQLARGKNAETYVDVGRQLPFAFSVELSEQLKHSGRQEGATPFMTLFALFALLLHDFTAQDDFAIGTDFANRSHVETENLLGFFVNQLLLRVRVNRAQTFQQFLAQVREVTLEAYANQDLPFDKLVEVMQPERAYGQNPLLQAKFVLQNTPVSAIALEELDIDLFDIQIESSKFDLLCNVVDGDQNIHGYWEYRVDVLDEVAATALCMQYTTIAEIVCTQPDLPLLDIFRQLSERRVYQQARQLQEVRETSAMKMQQVKRRTIIARKEDNNDG